MITVSKWHFGSAGRHHLLSFFFKDPNGYMFEVIAQEQYVAE